MKSFRLPKVADLNFPLSKPSWPGTLERGRPKSPLGQNFDTAWSRHYVVRLARAILLDNITRPALALVAKPEVAGLDRLEGLDTPVIFAANHASHLDTPLLLSLLPSRFRHKCVVGAGADYFFDRKWKGYLSSGLLAAIPIERLRVNRGSAELAGELIAKGWSLLLFPEGGRTPDGLGQTFRSGVAQLSLRTGAAVVPVFVEGTYEILGKNSSRIRPGKSRVNFGKPIVASEGQDVRSLVAEIQANIDYLAHETHSDYWTALVASHHQTTPSLAPEERGWLSDWQRSEHLPKRNLVRSWPRAFGSKEKKS